MKDEEVEEEEEEMAVMKGKKKMKGECIASGKIVETVEGKEGEIKK